MKHAKITDLAAGALDEVEELREKIDTLKARREEVADAPIPLSEALSKLDQALDGLAARFSPDIGLLGKNASHQDFAIGHGTGDRPTEMLVWLFRDQIRQRIAEEMTAHAPKGALAAKQRADRLAEIDRDLLAAEREEEALIVELEAGGFEIVRRPDADPRAVLEIED